MEITREEGDRKGRYVLVLDGHEAELTYSRMGSSAIIIDHTAVPDVLRGRGAGQALVARAVADARAEGRSIVPLCPFATAQIARHPDWHDVLQDSARRRLLAQQGGQDEQGAGSSSTRPPRRHEMAGMAGP